MKPIIIPWMRKTQSMEEDSIKDINASDCVHCGHCNSRCPFAVDQNLRMLEIRKYMDSFGEL